MSVHARQEWQAGTYDTHAHLVSDLAGGIMDWLAVVKAEGRRRPTGSPLVLHAENALAETVELLRPSLCDGEGKWTAYHVRLRVEAVK